MNPNEVRPGFIFLFSCILSFWIFVPSVSVILITSLFSDGFCNGMAQVTSRRFMKVRTFFFLAIHACATKDSLGVSRSCSPSGLEYQQCPSMTDISTVSDYDYTPLISVRSGRVTPSRLSQSVPVTPAPTSRRRRLLKRSETVEVPALERLRECPPLARGIRGDL